MLKKNLFKMVSLFTFVMLFLFNVVAFDCLASNQNGKSPNGDTLVNDFSSSSDEKFSNLAGENSQINGANGENNNGEKTVTEEEDLAALFDGVEDVTGELINQGINLTGNNDQSDHANEEEFDDGSWHEEEEEEEECREGYNFNIEEESSGDDDDVLELEINNEVDEDDYCTGEKC